MAVQSGGGLKESARLDVRFREGHQGAPTQLPSAKEEDETGHLDDRFLAISTHVLWLTIELAPPLLVENGPQTRVEKTMAVRADLNIPESSLEYRF